MGSSTRSRTERLALVLCACLPALALAASDEAKAKEKFKQGRLAFDVGRFDEALELYTEAYEAKPLPALLFNIAQCHRQMGNPERAIFFYQRFLSLAPPGTDRETVEKLIAEMERLKAAQEQKRRDDEGAARQKEEDDRRQQAEERAAADKRAQEAELARRLTEQPSEPPAVPVYKRWYFWGGVGVVVVAIAGGTAAAVATAPKPKMTTLGTDSAR